MTLRAWSAAFVLSGCLASSALAGPTYELDLTAGTASQDGGTSAFSAQARAFGFTESGLRYYLEASWADVSRKPTDTFGTSYPYDHRWTLMEAYVEQPISGTAGVRVGRFRPPFGLYQRSDHAYSGFLRAPLLRYAGYWGLNNFWSEMGIAAYGGTPALSYEAAIGTPQEYGGRPRRGTDLVGRLQSQQGDFIVGLSAIQTLPEEAYTFATGKAWFAGADLRWADEGWMVRGEYLGGRSYAGSTTLGWYVDVFLHKVWMGPVTAVARYEGLTWLAGRFSTTDHRATVGARVRLNPRVHLQLNLVHQPDGLSGSSDVSADVALTYSVRR